MAAATWPCPAATGGIAEEYAFTLDQRRDRRLLIVPALFDEANRLRRLALGVMHRLDGAGIDSILPDLPGTNESLQPLDALALADWMHAMEAAAAHFGATHVLALRGGALVAPITLPGWRLAPTSGSAILRQMLRMRLIAAREAGREESQAALLEQGGKSGLELAGHALSAGMVRDLQKAVVPDSTQVLIGQDLLGGAALWLRAEPDEDAGQADALAAILAMGMRA